AIAFPFEETAPVSIGVCPKRNNGYHAHHRVLLNVRFYDPTMIIISGEGNEQVTKVQEEPYSLCVKHTKKRAGL
ncbi:MAG: hypothetical protein KAX26_10170, partial [Anaerolineae bacterium]|nr:hypothetical protein [Anaerolineae bacterium]